MAKKELDPSPALEAKRAPPSLEEDSAFEQELHAFFRQAGTEEVPIEALLDKVRQTYPRQESPSGSLWWRWPVWGGLSVGMASLAALFVMLRPPELQTPIKQGRSITRKALVPDHLITRGAGPSFYVARKRQAQKRYVHSGEHFQIGDKLRLIVDWPAGGFLFVLHRDDKDALHPLYPSARHKRSIPWPKGKGRPLPGSLRVTAPARGNEEIWACFSTKPLTYVAVSKAIKEHNTMRRVSSPICRTLQLFVIARSKGE